MYIKLDTYGEKVLDSAGVSCIIGERSSSKRQREREKRYREKFYNYITFYLGHGTILPYRAHIIVL